MHRLLDLNNDELKQVFSLSQPYSDRVSKLIQDELNHASSESEPDLRVLRDEAFGYYWKRIIDDRKVLKEEDVDELLCSKMFPTSKSLLGEAIINNKVNVALCEKVLKKNEPESWLYKQAKSYILFSDIGKINMSKNIEGLLNLHCMWALYRVVDSIDRSSLKRFSKLLESNSSIPKKEKNRLRDKIRQRVKRDIHLEAE